MKISENQFTKIGFSKGTNSFGTFVRKSSNAFTKTAFKKSDNIFFGANTSETPYGVDDLFGGPFSTYGEIPYLGLGHFLLRQKYDVTH